MNFLLGDFLTEFEKSEQTKMIANTLSQLGRSIVQLQEQARQSGILLSDDVKLASEDDANNRIAPGFLPHTVISPTIDRGPVGRIQEVNTNKNEKARARAKRKE